MNSYLSCSKVGAIFLQTPTEKGVSELLECFIIVDTWNVQQSESKLLLWPPSPSFSPSSLFLMFFSIADEVRSLPGCLAHCVQYNIGLFNLAVLGDERFMTAKYKQTFCGMLISLQEGMLVFHFFMS